MTEDPVRLEPVERLQLQFDIDQLNAAYAAALDEKRFDAWPEFFWRTAVTPCRRARTMSGNCRWR